LAEPAEPSLRGRTAPTSAESRPRATPATPAPDRKPLVLAPIRRETLRPRTLAAVAVGILVVALARPDWTSVRVGLPLVLLGEAIRLWAAGHLYKTRELVTSGPYAHVRHPLYLGTLLAGGGLIATAGLRVALVAAPLGLLWFFAYYLPYKDRGEGNRLTIKYGEHFRAYRAAVPRLWPRPRPWRDPFRPVAPPWRFERVRDNGEVATALTVALAVLALISVGALRGGL
jgi:protein-S-isoprenylcysteine O-methyltransferase Ste14